MEEQIERFVKNSEGYWIYEQEQVSETGTRRPITYINEATVAKIMIQIGREIQRRIKRDENVRVRKNVESKNDSLAN